MLAVKKWSRIPCLKAGPGGDNIKTFRRKNYLQCEVRGQGVMRQTRISFSRTPTPAKQTGERHDGVGGSSAINFSSTTEGQTRGAARIVGVE